MKCSVHPARQVVSLGTLLGAGLPAPAKLPPSTCRRSRKPAPRRFFSREPRREHWAPPGANVAGQRRPTRPAFRTAAVLPENLLDAGRLPKFKGWRLLLDSIIERRQPLMFPWFQLLILGIIWKAFEDFWKEQIGNAEDAIREKLRSLEGGEQLGTSPLVKVLAVDNVADTVTILVRGPIKLTEGITPFMRIEVVISRGEINLTGDGPPIRIKDWRTVIGDIAITDEAAEGSLGFGYDNGAWLGEGSLKVGVTPMRLGAAIYGGISDRGMILGLDAEFPPGGAIPLGPTGLALRGLGGDFAYNFVARLEKDGMPIASPTAFDYVTWARDRQSVDRWKAGPIDKTAVGIAVRTILCTIADQGYVYELNPIGFAFLTPGGAFILGGKGRLLLRQ